MTFEFMVTVEVEREEGKFVSRDELGALLTEALDEANPGDLESDTGGIYNVTSWSIQDTTTKKRK